MKRSVKVMSLAALLLGGGAALAGGAGPVQHEPKPVVNSYRFDCEKGQSVRVRYIVSNPQLKRDPVFAVIGYQGQSYGLAPAVSASGTRYVGLSGLDTASGLEWWEHHNEGTLSRYNPATGDTTPLVSGCRIRL